MEHSPPSEAKSHSAFQETFRLLWNPKVHHSAQIPQLVPVLSQMNLVHTIQIFSHLRLGLRTDLFSLGFWINILCTFIIPMRAT
jgi:hypothetical protein